MTTTRTPLTRCSTRGCPFTPDEHEEWLTLCSQALEHGHRHDQPSHQHFPKKGMGGNNPKSKVVAILCWPMHDRIDNKDWGNGVFEVPGGKVYRAWTIHNETILERLANDGAELRSSGPDSSTGSAPSLGAGDGPAEDVGAQPSPALLMDGEEEAGRPGGSPDNRVYRDGRSSSPFSLEADWVILDDETLQQLYEEGEQRQQEGYLLKCKAVWAYRTRHVQSWGESWTDQAMERFGCSRPYAKAYANLWEIWLKSEPYLREGMASLTDSRSLMQAIGRKAVEEGTKLLEVAVAHVAEYGQPPKVASLTEQLERERCICPTCKFSHWARVEDE